MDEGSVFGQGRWGEGVHFAPASRHSVGGSLFAR
jgi:hypothetical protein